MKVEKYGTKEHLLPIIVTKTETLLTIADPYSKLQVHFSTETKQIVNIVTPWKEGFEPAKVELHLMHAYDRILRGMGKSDIKHEMAAYTPAMRTKCEEQGRSLVKTGGTFFSGTMVSGGKEFTITTQEKI